MKFPKKTTHKRKIIKKKLMSMKRLEMLTCQTFSQYIRLRDCHKYSKFNEWSKCYTCGKDFIFKDLEAGHFIPRGKTIYKFAEWNCHSQCCRCNRFLHGNLTQYTLNMIKEYGEGFVREKKAKENNYHKFSRIELIGIRQYYANKIVELI
jgi:hypothetical protein